MVYHQNRVENEIYVINGSAQGQEMQMPYLDIREIRSRPPGGMKNTKIQKYKNTKIQKYKNTKIQKNKNTKIQNTKIQKYKNTKIQKY